MGKRLAGLLADYYRRRAIGEGPTTEEYRERAGPEYAEFVRILESESRRDAPPKEAQEKKAFPRRFGRYLLLRELGRGSVGVVYEAVHKDLGRSVALKVLRTGFDTHPLAIERFRREARACSQVRHSNIVHIYEAGEHEGRLYYAMAMIEGDSLRELVKQGVLPPATEVCRAAAGLADALHALHEHGIIHRDVKPSNVIVDAAGRMVLADFGLVRTVAGQSITKTGEALGTPLYMSPEQMLGNRDEINARTDVYGLGATLYEALAGKTLFRHNDPQGILRLVLSSTPTPPIEINPDVPPAANDIVMRALAKRNDERYESAAAMRDDLLACARGDEPADDDVAPRRHGLLAIAAVAVAGLLAAFFWRGARPASLRVASFPEARVTLDEQELGATNASYRVSPGAHTLRLTREGFRPRRASLDLEPAGDYHLEYVLLPLDNDSEATGVLARSLGITFAAPPQRERFRTGADSAVARPCLPRGPVARGDLDDFWIFVDADARGNIVFKVDGDTLLDTPYDPENVWSNAPIPAEVKERLVEGTRVTWGFVDKRGKASLAEFVVVAPAALPPRIAALEESAPRLLKLLTAQIALDAGRAYAAYRAAADVADNRIACAIQLRALQELSIDEPRLWGPLERQLTELSR